MTYEPKAVFFGAEKLITLQLHYKAIYLDISKKFFKNEKSAQLCFQSK